MRTVLVADSNEGSRERIARIAHEAGYRVLKARTPKEAAGALGACPISGVVADENLLKHCDLGQLLLRAPILVLSARRRAILAEDIAVVPKDAPDEDLKNRLVALVGHPRYLGSREIVSLSRSPA